MRRRPFSISLPALRRPERRTVLPWAAWMLALICLAALIVRTEDLLRREMEYFLEEGLEESYEFRNMTIAPSAYEALAHYADENGIDRWELLASAMITQDFVLEEEPAPEQEDEWAKLAQAYTGKEGEGFTALADSYQAVLADVQYFPVPYSSISKADVSYENSWMFERNFGGTRGHEGTDLMPTVDQAGLYPVVSMTDGTVERVGWLTKGGYRIGVRSLSGGYFYYAHLSAYASDFREGDTVKAGQILGYMGDTGYGEEGTTGQFAVHLHLGIYIRTANYAELSVNPYWVLRGIEEERLTYQF